MLSFNVLPPAWFYRHCEICDSAAFHLSCCKIDGPESECHGPFFRLSHISELISRINLTKNVLRELIFDFSLFSLYFYQFLSFTCFPAFLGFVLPFFLLSLTKHLFVKVSCLFSCLFHITVRCRSCWCPFRVSPWSVACWVVLFLSSLFGVLFPPSSLCGWCCCHLSPRDKEEKALHNKAAGGEGRKAPPP